MPTAGKIQQIIIGELRDVIEKYSQPRRSELVYAADIVVEEEEEDTPDYPCIFSSRAMAISKRLRRFPCA